MKTSAVTAAAKTHNIKFVKAFRHEAKNGTTRVKLWCVHKTNAGNAINALRLMFPEARVELRAPTFHNDLRFVCSVYDIALYFPSDL